MRVLASVGRLLRSLGLHREEGQVLPMFAVMIFAIVAMTGVVVDGGNLWQNRQSLQNAADASAIAAAQYLADPTKLCQVAGGTAPDQIGCWAAEYAGINGAPGLTDQAGNVVTALQPCSTFDPSVSDTTAPKNPPGCYVYTPATGTASGNIEVWLTKTTQNFFGGLFGLTVSAESARAIGTVTPGNPPPIAFAALNDDPSCPNHTLLIKLGGVLKVNSGIYVNSCNQGDGFDVFNGGSISAPQIETSGGWETHDGSNVYVPDGTLCSFPRRNGNWHITGNPPGYGPPTPAGCPDVGRQKILDPFAGFPPAPDLGSGNVGVPVSITKISRGAGNSPSNAANIAEVVTQAPHNLAVNDSFAISGVGSGFDGSYTVASVKSSTDFTFNNSLGSDGCGAAPCPNVPAISQEQMAGGVVTLTTNAPTTLAVNDSVTVSGLNVNGLQPFFNVTNAMVTGTGLSSFSFNSPLASRQFTISNKARSSGTATIKLNSIAGLAAGDTLNVTLTTADALLPNGSYVLTNVGNACPAGVATSVCYAVPPATTQLNVTKKAVATNANGSFATLTVTNNTAVVGDQVTVKLSDPNDSRFDGTFTLTAAAGGAGGTVTFPLVVQANVNHTGSAGGTVTVKAGQSPFEQGDLVSVDSPLAYAGSITLNGTNFTPATHSFTFTSKTFQNVSWTKSGNLITATTASAHGLNPGDSIKVTGAPTGGSCSTGAGATFPVTAATATTFTYTVPAACNPGASGSQAYNFQVWTAATAAASGTVTLTTMPPTATTPNPCVKCITVPAFEAATVTTGSAVLTDVPATAVSGTFTPAWMPTVGVLAKNLPGSAGIPSPTVITTGTQTLNPGTYYGGICIGVAAGLDCGKDSKPANCTAVGGSTTTVQSYPTVVNLTADVPDNFDATFGAGTIQVAPAGIIAKGDLIAIDDEEFTVTDVPVGGAVPVQREANGTENAAHKSGTEVKIVVTAPNGTPYSTAVTLTANVTAAATTLPVNTTAPVGIGDIVQVDNEAMTVTNINAAAKTLTVTRGTYNTTPVSHLNKAPVLKVFDASAPPPPTVTLNKGVYIMAGGGFSVCGAANLNTPNGVLIYNTNDPPHPTGYGALGQIDINTSGTVHLHPMTDGIYAGLTIFQDRNLTLVAGANCGGKSGNSSQWDIALQSAAPLPVSGALGSISGTIYSPHLGADFADSMSGTANLAIISSCIYINGANSTFNHTVDDPQNPLFGVSATLGG